MSLIVAARFDTFALAQDAARALFASGFDEDDVTLFFVNPAGQHDRLAIGGDKEADPEVREAHKGAGIGGALFAAFGAAVGAIIAALLHVSTYLVVLVAAVGAYAGTLAGALWHAKPGASARQASRPPARHAGVLVAVHVAPEKERNAAEVLMEHGGADIERADGRWRQGEWVDFDPVAAPRLAPRVSTYNSTERGHA